MWRASAFLDCQGIRRIIRGQIVEKQEEEGKNQKRIRIEQNRTEWDNLQISLLIQILNTKDASKDNTKDMT